MSQRKTCYAQHSQVRAIRKKMSEIITREWSFGQQLPLLMLILPAMGMAEIFFDELEDASSKAKPTSHMKAATPTAHSSTDPLMSGGLVTSASFGRGTGTDDPLQEVHMLRRRIDTEQRVGMDIVDAVTEPHSPLIPTSQEEHEKPAQLELTPTTSEEQTLKLTFAVKLFMFAGSDDLKEKLWATKTFKLYLFIVYTTLTWIILRYGI